MGQSKKTSDLYGCSLVLPTFRFWKMDWAQIGPLKPRLTKNNPQRHIFALSELYCEVLKGFLKKIESAGKLVRIFILNIITISKMWSILKTILALVAIGALAGTNARAVRPSHQACNPYGGNWCCRAVGGGRWCLDGSCFCQWSLHAKSTPMNVIAFALSFYLRSEHEIVNIIDSSFW